MTSKFVARVPLERVRNQGLVRVPYPPYDVCVALVDGVPHAIEDSCNHAGASLAEGSQKGDCVSCPMHGYVFSLVTGELVIPRGLCGDQRPFKARIDGDDVVIEDDFELELER